MTQKPKKYEDVLMRALKFDETDLAANEAGEWSAAQVAKWSRARRDHLVALLVAFGFTALFLVFTARASTNIGVLLNGGALFGTLVTVGYLSGRLDRVLRDLHDGARTVEGRVELDVDTRNNKTKYTAKIGGMKFKISKMTFLAFKNGDPYRVYYAPHQKRIASVEWLRDDDPFAPDINRAARLADAPTEAEDARQHRGV